MSTWASRSLVFARTKYKTAWLCRIKTRKRRPGAFRWKTSGRCNTLVTKVCSLPLLEPSRNAFEFYRIYIRGWRTAGAEKKSTTRRIRENFCQPGSAVNSTAAPGPLYLSAEFGKREREGKKKISVPRCVLCTAVFRARGKKAVQRPAAFKLRPWSERYPKVRRNEFVRARL